MKLLDLLSNLKAKSKNIGSTKNVNKLSNRLEMIKKIKNNKNPSKDNQLNDLDNDNDTSTILDEEDSVEVIKLRSQLPAYVNIIPIQNILESNAYIHFEQIKDKFLVFHLDDGSIMMGATKDMFNSYLMYDVINLYKSKNIEVNIVRCLADTLIQSLSEETIISYDANNTQTEVEEKFDELIVSASNANVSDIHIVRDAVRAYIYFRIDGDLVLNQEVLGMDAHRIVSVAYNVLADSKSGSWNSNFAQDASIGRVVNGVNYRLRYAHHSIHSSGEGFHAVFRLLNVAKKVKKEELNLGFSRLGFNENQEDMIKNILSKPSGLIIISGTTGSGKTVTIKEMLEWIYYIHRDRKVTMLTVEDPVELKVDGAIQSSVVRFSDDSQTDRNPFADAVISAMRRDPDIIMVGETRDKVTTKALVNATETGHLVLTTLHVGSALGIPQRLESLGVDRFRLGSPDFLSGLIYQKLIKIICNNCKLSLAKVKKSKIYDNQFIDRIESVIDDTTNIAVINPDGCNECNFKGTKGRSVCAEMIMPDDNLLQFFKDANYTEARHYLSSIKDKHPIKAMGYSILDNAIELIKEGKACPRYIEQLLGRLDSKK